MRRPSARLRLAPIAALALVVAASVPAIAATGGWSLTRTPSSVTDSVATDVSLTATDAPGGSSVGCVALVLPAAFTVNSVAIDSATSPYTWTADPPSGGPPGTTTVTVHGVAETDKLNGTGQFVTFHVNVTGTPVGTYTWNATSYDHANCSAGADTASVSVSVVAGAPPANQPPVASDDGPYSTVAGVPLSVAAPGVLANDTDPDGDPISAQVATQPAHGALTLGSDGSLAYTPDAGYAGADSFTYRAFDGAATSSPATVALSVTNVAPTAVNDAYTTPKSVALVVSAPNGVLANDTDPDTGQTLTASVATAPTHGGLSLAADGSFTYTPNAGYVGTDTFTYHVSDGVATDTGTVTLTMTNAAPVANDDLYSGAKNLPLIVGAPGILGNDTDADGDPLTATVVTGPSSGILLPSANGGFTYTPNLGFTGTDSFTYTASDGIATSAPATVVLAISNTAPVAADDSASVAHDRTLTVGGSGVLANDTDANGDSLTADLVSTVSHGTLNLRADGTYTYTPDVGYVGSDSFTYRADDAAATSNLATVTISVVNGAPTATDDSYAVHKNVAVTAVAPGILGNDSDPDGDTLTPTVTVAPSHGTLTLQPDGSFRYTPVGGYVGTDTATYVVSDGLVTSAPATVTFTVTNDAPIAADDSGATNRNTMLVVAAASGVLANDTDANGDPLTAVVVTAPAHGGLTLNPDGSYAYVPDPDWVGTDTFTYEASDGTAVSSPATVTIVVTNHAPVAAPDAWTVVHDHVLTVAAPGVLGNDTDVDGDVLSASVTAVPAHGSLSLASDGSFTFVADPGYAGSDSFSYAVSDGLSSDTATVTITITNGTPVAVDSSWSTSQDTALVASAPGLLAGASDADGDPLSAVVVTLPAHGSVTIDPSGSFIYTPSAGYVGPDAFTFAASDGVTTSAAATASVTVSAPTPTPPPSGSASATPPRSTSPPPTSPPPTSPPPTSRPSTSPVPTATASVVPTPSGSASPRPTVVGTPSPQPSSAPPLPPSAPPSSPPSSPLPAPSVSASGTPTPNPTASLPPTAAPTSATGGSPGPAAFGSTDRFVVGPPGGSATAGIDFGSLSPALAGFGGLLEWAVPGLVMSVPGLLLVVAIGAQVVGASAWIPIIRRSLGVFGVGRRRRRQAGARP